ncbi:Uncharacterized protein APZ42_031261 [Daphnia magna]|uniref:Uncharacterized protein n=1 Tax=Daphnia magna TaxID=35525 RepID=A0A164N060_9CRUS|nr:Uncharacterized protein APZ42_031261 [Daphnia magna]
MDHICVCFIMCGLMQFNLIPWRSLTDSVKSLIYLQASCMLVNSVETQSSLVSICPCHLKAIYLHK